MLMLLFIDSAVDQTRGAHNIPPTVEFNVNACNESEYGCLNGQCLPRFQRCNQGCQIKIAYLN